MHIKQPAALTIVPELAPTTGKTLRARPTAADVIRMIEWDKDKNTGLCHITQTSNNTCSFLKHDRQRLEDLIDCAMLYASTCRKHKTRIDPLDLERLYPKLILPDHMLQDIIDAPQNRTAKQRAVSFYAELLDRTEQGIQKDLFRKLS
jgi:hypothetical protein